MDAGAGTVSARVPGPGSGRIAWCSRAATLSNSARNASRVLPRVFTAWQFGHSATICEGWSRPSAVISTT